MKKIILLTALMPFFICLGQNKNPGWLNTAVFYQIYPQSFKDSNGDGIGDLNGITEKIDYIKSIGITAIWLNPIFESPFKDAGYDVSDYYRIASRYGSENDLKKLLETAHANNIKIVLDLVAGHTSDQHQWFKESQSNKKNQYSDFYIWTDSKTLKPDKYISGNFQRDGNYMKNFFDCQPALNYGFAKTTNKWEQNITDEGPKAVRAELIKIIDFWMQKGVDGFRVDMASSLIKNDSNFTQTKILWQGIRKWMEEKYPQGVLIAEWSNPKQAIEAGFMIDFMMQFNVPGYPSMFFNKGGVFEHDTCYFDLLGNGSPMEFINNYIDQIKSVGNLGYVSVPTSNHDINRLNSGNRNTNDQLQTTLAFLLTLKGIPLIYYGEEIGMRYIPNLPDKEGSVLVNYGNQNRAGTRTPMQWNSLMNAGFSTAKASDLYLPVDTIKGFPNVAEQQLNPNSLLNFTKTLLQLRIKHPSLGNNGDIQFFNTEQNKYPLCYIRTAPNEKCLIVINPINKKDKLIIDLSNVKTIQSLLVNNVTIDVNAKNLCINTNGVGFGIFILR